MTTERLRNQYPDHCRVCGTDVPAQTGWLYAKWNGGRKYDRFVKCDRCHCMKACHKWDLPENRPSEPILPSIGVAELRAGRLEFGSSCGNLDVARWTLADGRSEVVCWTHPISDMPTYKPIDSKYDDHNFFGGKLTPASVREYNAICERSLPFYAAYLESIYPVGS